MLEPLRETQRSLICSMGGFPFPSEVDLNDAFIILNMVQAAFAENVTLVQDGHFTAELADENHIVFDDEDRVLSSEAEEEFPGFFRFLI